MVALGKRGSRVGMEALRILKRQSQSNEPPRGRPAPVMTASPSPVPEAASEAPVPTTLSTVARVSSESSSSASASATTTTTSSAAPLGSPTILLTAPSATGAVFNSPYPPVQTLSSPPPVIYTSIPGRASPARDNVGNAIGIVFGALACAITIGFILVICTVRRRRARNSPAAKPKAAEPPPPYSDKPVKHLSTLMAPMAPLHTPMAELSAQSPAIPGPQEMAVPSPIKSSNTDRPASPWPFLNTTTTTTVTATTTTTTSPLSPSPLGRSVITGERSEPPLAPPPSFVLQPPPKTLFSRLHSRYNSSRYSKRSTGLTMLDEMQFSTYCKLSGGAKSPISDKANKVLGKTDDESLARPAPAFHGLQPPKSPFRFQPPKSPFRFQPPRSPFKMLGRFPTRDEWKSGRVASGYCS
ncbi:hypothetical protein GGTG_02223 [Gaeumannomyces tritici R3-111a-1]|uniref:Uncharacterized protein n=1 Tax=Gaeumannomyces tritici (strain R3-111a-1) TaxID=644352 RepID=J3NLS3_GAET3|nr:hypothetical protein GGTG_02223 [Gaeumannomyces tritici R3-111a-1]EJT82249.1 hypothetical protein GGTG_02223 [Gaeumannomyces tritici R3-111a-1]